MLLSMTGFGTKAISGLNKNYSIEIKSLNSKGLEINLKLPLYFKPIEFQIKQKLQNQLFRGSIECIIYQVQEKNSQININQSFAIEYANQLKQLANTLQLPHEQILNLVVNHPDAINSNSSQMIAQEDALLVIDNIDLIIEDVFRFRKNEGKILEDEILLRITNILNAKQTIKENQSQRATLMRDKLINKIESNIGANYDKDRLEQEMIYYIEKMDITEELVRLQAHCDFMIDTINEKQENCKGKKMGFITQEIMREINTLGSKAQDAAIQKIVIFMKDETEKIKEQINNIL